MPGSTPIRNGKLQTSFDFNNQSITQANEAKKLTVVNNSSTGYTLQATDAFSIQNMTGGGTTLYAPALGTTIPYGSEVLFYTSTAGNIFVTATGGATIVAAKDPASPANDVNSTRGIYAVGCLIYVSANKWLLTGNVYYD
jgi:hypothetical protein